MALPSVSMHTLLIAAAPSFPLARPLSSFRGARPPADAAHDSIRDGNTVNSAGRPWQRITGTHGNHGSERKQDPESIRTGWCALVVGALDSWSKCAATTAGVCGHFL